MKSIVRSLLLFAAEVLSAWAQPSIASVTNGFSFTTKLSPGVLASIFGSNLSGNSVTVTLNGTECPVTFASAAQVNIQIPWEATTGGGRVVVTVDGVRSAPFTVTISKYSPALASFEGSGSGTGEFLSGANFIGSTNPANGGDTLTTYAVGLGGTTPSIATGELTPNPPLYTTLVTPTMTVGKAPTTILFSGLAPGVLATDQINFTLAPNTPVGTDTVVLTVSGVATNQITIPIGCLDETANVSVALGPLNHPVSGKYTQKVTITNTSTKTLPARGSLVLTGLTSSATLADGGGATCPSSDSSPYKSFAFTGTGSAQTATFTLEFTDTSTGAISYGQRVLVK